MRDVSKIRDQLKSRLESLKQRIGEIEGDLRTARSTNWEEQATETQGDQVLEGVEGSALIEAQQVHAALTRIDAGTYGECSTCGKPVGENRLQALPYATRWGGPRASQLDLSRPVRVQGDGRASYPSIGTTVSDGSTLFDQA